MVPVTKSFNKLLIALDITGYNIHNKHNNY